MGQRVVQGQRLMQAVSDIFLGWQRMESTTDGRAGFGPRDPSEWCGPAAFAGMARTVGPAGTSRPDLLG